MKKILFIGNYKSQSGWGYAAREYLEALLLTKNNIVARPAYLCNSPLLSPSEKILEAENNRFDSKPDVVIQNVLPDLFVKHDAYNIGIVHTETRNTNQIWLNKINLLDELWVNSGLEKQSLINDGVTCKIGVVQIPSDTKKLAKYSKFAEPLNIPELNGKFVFYFIGEYSDRKNIMAFAQAFHREFSCEEQVAYVLKTSRPGIKEEINNWKKNSRTRAVYLPDVLIEGPVEEKFIYSLHNECDCFVCTSRGESNCQPIADALYFNNTVICTDNIGPASLYEVIRVNSTEVPVNTNQPPVNHIYTGKETWFDIDILDLQKKMREVFENRPVNNTKEYIENNFSRQKISEKISKCLS